MITVSVCMCDQSRTRTLSIVQIFRELLRRCSRD
jgi:hypothetical protein